MRDVKRGGLQITAYRKAEDDLKIQPAPSKREWIESLSSRFVYRCLPLLIANQAGWFLLNNRSFEAVWSGGRSQSSLRVRYGRGDGIRCAESHFGYGILTFRLPFLFRTSPGSDLWVRGPSNLPKDGISALEGIVETSWAVAPFTMNWKFTRPHHRVRFEADEPIAMLVPFRSDELEMFEPRIQPLDDNADLKESFLAWQASRAAFFARPREIDGTKQPPWQKHYFLGTSPDGTRAPSHRQKLRVKDFKLNS